MTLIQFQPDHWQELPEGGQWVHPRYRLQVTAHDKVWRIYLSHRSEDHDKPSRFERPPVPTTTQQEGGQVRCDTAAQGAFVSDVGPFRFQLGPLHNLGMITEPTESWVQQEAREEGDPHIFQGHPVREQLNGTPLGAGVTLSFQLSDDLDFYGLGGRTGFLNKRGRRWHQWATDEFFHTPQADPLYQAHPFLLLRQGENYWGLFLDESWYSVFDLGYTLPDQWMLHTAGSTCDLYLIQGENPAEILQRYTEAVGRAPMPPLWALGVHQCRWSYPNATAAQDIVRQYAAHDLPLDALWLDIDYMDAYKVFTFSTHRFPDPETLIQGWQDQGVKTVVIVDPGVKRERYYPVYEAGHAESLFVRNQRDEELVGEVWPSPVVWPDFSLERTRQWWGDLHSFYTHKGVAGIWNDMNEPAAFRWPGKTLPLDARQNQGSHAQFHNLYGLQMAQATYEGLQRLHPDKRPFVLTRSGAPGIQQYAWVWTGDNSSFWEHLEASVPMLLNLGMSGVPFAGADIGGFSGSADGELLTAWTWLGVFYPFMRNHSAKINRSQEPWIFGEPWLSHIREALQFRYELLPYLYTLAEQAHRTGAPLMRPLYYHYPQDPETRHAYDSFLMGEDLLVAPVLRPAQQRRLVYLPAGQWEDFWTGEVYAGEQWRVHEVSYARPGLFQRCGSAIPLQPTQRHTQDAWWPGLYWRVSPLGSPAQWQAEGQVFCDAGEGFVPGTRDTLRVHGQADALQFLAHDFTTRGIPARLRIAQKGYPQRREWMP